MRVEDCGQLPIAVTTDGANGAAAAAAAAAKCLSAARQKYFPTSSYTVVGEVKKLVLCVGSFFHAEEALPGSCAASVDFEAGYVAAFLKAARQGFTSALVVHPAPAGPDVTSGSAAAAAEQTDLESFVNRVKELLGGHNSAIETEKDSANKADFSLEFTGTADPIAWLSASYAEVCAGAIVHAQFFGGVDVAALAAAVQMVMTGGTGGTDPSTESCTTVATKTSLRCPMVSLSASFVNSSDNDNDADNDSSSSRKGGSSARGGGGGGGGILHMLRGLDLPDPGFCAEQHALVGASTAPTAPVESSGANASGAGGSEKHDRNNNNPTSVHGELGSGAGSRAIEHAGLFLVRRTVSKALRAHATRAGAIHKKYPDTQSRRQFAYMKR